MPAWIRRTVLFALRYNAEIAVVLAVGTGFAMLVLLVLLVR